METEKQITNKDCTFLLLAKLPNGKIHQVLIKDEDIQHFINQLNEFKMLETPVLGIDFE